MNDEFAGVADLEDTEDAGAVLSDDVLDGLGADLEETDEDEDDFGGAVAAVGEDEDESGWGMD